MLQVPEMRFLEQDPEKGVSCYAIEERSMSALGVSKRAAEKLGIEGVRLTEAKIMS